MEEQEIKEEKNEVPQAEAEVEAAAKSKVRRKKKPKRLVGKGLVYINSSFNNTIVTITDTSGNTIAWASAGSRGFKGSKKGTPYAAGLAASAALEKAKGNGLSAVDVFISGVGSGRETALRSIIGDGAVTINMIRDITPIPHNGCRPKKARRV